MGGCFSSRVKTERPSPSHNGLNSKVDGTLKCFTLKELKTATRKLVPGNRVSKGEFCCVKGWIDEHTLAPSKPGSGFTIYVKKLNHVGHQERSEWLRKINNMGQLSHPNLVRLIGYCLEDFYPILVYEFLAKGSLDNHLFHRNSNFQPLPWKMRMKIVLDAAKGLAFLHSDEVDVMHGDFKTSNILIDSNHNAKLMDFGLDKDRSEKDYVIYWGGSKGYIAPEYIETGHKTKKGDVFSFGVVLLEIMSGKPAFDENRPPCERRLVEWAKKLLISKHKIFHVMDPCIEGQYSRREAMKVAHIALQCLSKGPDDRPNIDEVVRSLEQLQVSNDIVAGVGSLI